MTQRRLTAALIAILVAVCLVGGAGAYLLGRWRADSAVAQRSLPARQSPSGSGTSPAAPGGISTAPTAQGPEAANTSQGATVPSKRRSGTQTTPAPESSGSSAAEPTVPTPDNDTTVRLSSASKDAPDADQVRELLQRHFDGINLRRYDLWAGSVVTELSRKIPRQRWAKEYASTVDTDITVLEIRQQPLQARVSFRSRQAVKDAPRSMPYPCLNWEVSYPIVRQDGELRIAPAAAGMSQARACQEG